MEVVVFLNLQKNMTKTMKLVVVVVVVVVVVAAVVVVVVVVVRNITSRPIINFLFYI